MGQKGYIRARSDASLHLISSRGENGFNPVVKKISRQLPGMLDVQRV
jgi:hypothetical protein